MWWCPWGVSATSEAKLERSLEPRNSFFEQKEKGCSVAESFPGPAWLTVRTNLSHPPVPQPLLQHTGDVRSTAEHGGAHL